MIVAFGLGMRLHVHLRPNLENGVLCDGQHVCGKVIRLLLKYYVSVPSLHRESTYGMYKKFTTSDAYRAGAVKHKEQGYCSFRDDHVRKCVKSHPGSSSDNHYIFHAEVKPSMKNNW